MMRARVCVKFSDEEEWREITSEVKGREGGNERAAREMA
jgi:hypothetical protein